MTDPVPFATLNRLVADLTLARETHVLRYGLTVHRALAELLYRGAELGALCSQMARMSQRPVAVFDSHGQLAALEQRQQRVVEPADLARALAEQADALGTREQPEDLHPRVAEITARRPRASPASSRPIVLGGRHDGWILLLEDSDDPHPHDLAEHRVLVEQAAPIIGTEMLRLRSVQRAKEQARGDFVHGLLHGRFATLEDISARAAHYEFPVRSWFGVLIASGITVARGRRLPGPAAAGRGAGRPVAARAGAAHPGRDGRRRAGRRPRGRAPRHDGHAGGRGRHDRRLRDGAARLPEPSARTRAGARSGSPTAGRSWAPSRSRTATARPAWRTGCSSGSACRRCAATRSSGCTPCWRTSPTSRTGQSFATDILAPLRDPNVGDLESAVLAYVASGGNVNAASRDLHIHRNTMLYKLDRASRLLGMDLRQADNQFAVWLAHTLDLLANTTAEVDRVVSPPLDRHGGRRVGHLAAEEAEDETADGDRRAAGEQPDQGVGPGGGDRGRADRGAHEPHHVEQPEAGAALPGR